MSTTGVESWAVDLKDIGAIYPFQGSEGILVIVGLLLWIGWHMWCAGWERQYHEEIIRKFGDKEIVRKAIDAD
jgi:hypothetical protein